MAKTHSLAYKFSPGLDDHSTAQYMPGQIHLSFDKDRKMLKETTETGTVGAGPNLKGVPWGSGYHCRSHRSQQQTGDYEGICLCAATLGTWSQTHLKSHKHTNYLILCKQLIHLILRNMELVLLPIMAHGKALECASEIMTGISRVQHSVWMSTSSDSIA